MEYVLILTEILKENIWAVVEESNSLKYVNNDRLELFLKKYVLTVRPGASLRRTMCLEMAPAGQFLSHRWLMGPARGSRVLHVARGMAHTRISSWVILVSSPELLLWFKSLLGELMTSQDSLLSGTDNSLSPWRSGQTDLPYATRYHPHWNVRSTPASPVPTAPATHRFLPGWVLVSGDSVAAIPGYAELWV